LEELKKISIEHKERYMSDIRNFKYVTFSWKLITATNFPSQF
jgi:hypothetical protein